MVKDWGEPEKSEIIDKRQQNTSFLQQINFA
jgi:hypothetical protein